MRPIIRRAANTKALVAVLTLATPNGGRPQERSQPIFRTGTEIVEVDVAVREAGSGRPVRDLRREDFSVFEYGRKQTISHFGVLRHMPFDHAGAPAKQGSFTNRVSVSGPPNVVAIVIDALNARFEDPLYAREARPRRCASRRSAPGSGCTR